MGDTGAIVGLVAVPAVSQLFPSVRTGTLGAALHQVLQRPAQRPQAALALPHVQRRAGDQLLQEPIHPAGVDATDGRPPPVQRVGRVDGHAAQRGHRHQDGPPPPGLLSLPIDPSRAAFLLAVFGLFIQFSIPSAQSIDCRTCNITFQMFWVLLLT